MKYVEDNHTRFVCKICGVVVNGHEDRETIEEHRDNSKHYEFIGDPYIRRRYIINSRT